MNSIDVTALQYLCTTFFTPDRFISFSSRLKKFYKKNQDLQGATTSRLQELVNELSPGALALQQDYQLLPNAWAVPAVPAPLPQEAHFIKGSL